MNDTTSLELAPNVHELLQEGIALNTTATVYKPNSRSLPEFFGSPIEKAILSWAVLDLRMNLYDPKQNCVQIHVVAFNSVKKRNEALIRRKSKSAAHIHWKGAAEMIVGMCSQYYDRSGTINAISDEEKT
ncbi:hypothetical protein PTKIN_Ptkin11bG0102800 [Pterospermum kingtungense]